MSEVKVVTHDYFKAMGIPLLRGRLFDGRDTAPNPRRIIVSDSLVKRYFGEFGSDWPTNCVVVEQPGARRNRRRRRRCALDQPRNRAAGTSYLPPARFAYPFTSVVVKTSDDGMQLVPSLIAAVHELDPDVPVADIRPMTEVMSISTAQRRLTMVMLMVFAALALVLASVGIYGVISYSVTQRTQEIGIRMALGAQRGDVLRMVVGGALLLSICGILLGGVGAVVLTELMTKLLFGVTPQDPVTFALVSLLLLAVAALASYLPGRRATDVDPVVALRAE